MGKFKWIQEAQYIETILCGLFHDQNKYEIIDAMKQQPVYVIQEESSILYRCTPLLHCPPPARPYKSTITQVGAQPIARNERPCKCTIYCICRPEVIVTDAAGAQLGRCFNPCLPLFCCNMRVQVFDKLDAHQYDIHLCVCNFHVLCECCAGPCAETEIKIEAGDAGNQAFMPQTLKKYFSSFGRDCFSPADEYEFDVPDEWGPEPWALFLSALQFFDMLFFEESCVCLNVRCKCCVA